MTILVLFHSNLLRLDKTSVIEQDHRFTKNRVRAMLGLKKLSTAKFILSRIEQMYMVRK
ncbi:DDE-type integrase/transposase/recombinase [Acinetobacter sp. FNA3]|nr:DDE-type integrase/transposase/recombinase [Acinetobacter pollinis]MBF7701882.1 DDE-type integrase/transposase/recombinase [Acinetobacter pollinis]